MSVLTGRNLALAHGDFDVFQGISFDVPNDAKVGMVGPNGIGKTTLLRVMAGLTAPDAGAIHQARGTRLGYLRQEAVEAFANRSHSIYAEMLTVFAPVLAQADQLREMESAMGAGDFGDELLERYGAMQEAFEHAGGYEYDVRIAQVLEGLDFPRPLWETPLSHLSGGQKTRVLLARLLLEEPDLLILDEPTNHLDVDAVDWLEATLQNWKGALLIVSHDRYFLNRVVDHVWEMSRTYIETYRGNYNAYLKQRAERWDQAQLIYEREKERLREELELVRRYIAWRKFTEAAGKLKLLSRDLAMIDKFGLVGAQGKDWSESGLGRLTPFTIEEAHERIRAIRRPVRPATATMKLKAAARGGTIVLRTKGVEVGYPGVPLFKSDDVELLREDCAALIGPNGAGKTTFLRTILEQLAPLAGRVERGAGLKIGYFAQAHDALNPENTVVDELMSHRKGMTIPEARDHLAQYLFRGDDVFKQIDMLSGGERGRLALAVLALDGANFLLLDEPTNHLDIPAQEVLQAALERFEGTLLMVSHDRYLVDRLASQVWEVRDGRLRVFKGNYKEYAAAREIEARREKEESGQQRRAAKIEQAAANAVAESDGRQANAVAGSNGRQGNGVGGANRRNAGANGRDARKRAELLAALERQIAAAEAQLAECSRTLQKESEAQRVEEVARLGETYTAMEAQLDSLMTEWASLSAE